MKQTKTMRIDKTGHRRHGFTLIELLIVMALILILTAIMIPAGSYLLRNSQAAPLQAQFERIAHAIQEYERDTGRISPYDQAGVSFLCPKYLDRKDAFDPWGREIIVRCLNCTYENIHGIPQVTGGGTFMFGLVSGGPDGRSPIGYP